MNATELIRQWSMSGACRDVVDRFRSVDDIRGILSARSQTPAAGVLMMRGDEGDWRPLLLGTREGGGGRV